MCPIKDRSIFRLLRSSIRMSNLSGYGPSKHRLAFNGDEGGYELWETKFLAHLHLKELADVIESDSTPDADENRKVLL